MHLHGKFCGDLPRVIIMIMSLLHKTRELSLQIFKYGDVRNLDCHGTEFYAPSAPLGDHKLLHVHIHMLTNLYGM